MITFHVWDIDLYGKKTNLGTAKLAHGAFIMQKSFALPLKDGPTGCENSTLEVSIGPAKLEPVRINIQRATNLVNKDCVVAGRLDPMCTVTIGDSHWRFDHFSCTGW